MTARKELPIGIQTFAKIREGSHYYVDKTGLALDLGDGVYNPFDILQLFDKRQLRNYWFETGTPTFLLNLLLKRQVPTLKLDNMLSSSAMLRLLRECVLLLLRCGLDVTVEDCTNHGRLDMVLKFNRQVYVFEFKVVEITPAGKALQQIRDKAYADKYRYLQQPIHLLGVEFSKVDRNIVGFEVELDYPPRLSA